MTRASFSTPAALVLALAALGLATGCGPRKVDPKLATYVSKFEQEAHSSVSSNVEFKTLDGYRGFCNPDMPRNHVWIDPRAWADTEGDAIAQELLVFHELGHCELSRPHDNREDSRGIPVSIMTSEGLGMLEASYSENRQQYIDELFRRPEAQADATATP
ncbi:MAG TPA: hypothetical protein VL588_07420 [Bdellovibrionota bacterium]|nr:hypothetical protein [Bdellovibrionota bacterium]